MNWYVGLDLAKEYDYTALAAVQKVPVFDQRRGKWDYDLHLRGLQRWPLGTPYTRVADELKTILGSPTFTQSVFNPATRRHAVHKTELLVDRTGVGVAALDIYRERGIPFTAITFRPNSEEMRRASRDHYYVPTQDLVSALEVPFHRLVASEEAQATGDPPYTKVLRIAEGLELWPTLRNELLNFRRKQNKKTGSTSFEHWRQGDHDDLVFAAAMACWKANYKTKGTTRLKVHR
jgi:hypothetical protein